MSEAPGFREIIQQPPLRLLDVVLPAGSPNVEQVVDVPTPFDLYVHSVKLQTGVRKDAELSADDHKRVADAFVSQSIARFGEYGRKYPAGYAVLSALSPVNPGRDTKQINSESALLDPENIAGYLELVQATGNPDGTWGLENPGRLLEQLASLEFFQFQPSQIAEKQTFFEDMRKRADMPADYMWVVESQADALREDHRMEAYEKLLELLYGERWTAYKYAVGITDATDFSLCVRELTRAYGETRNSIHLAAKKAEVDTLVGYLKLQANEPGDPS